MTSRIRLTRSNVVSICHAKAAAYASRPHMNIAKGRRHSAAVWPFDHSLAILDFQLDVFWSIRWIIL